MDNLIISSNNDPIPTTGIHWNENIVIWTIFSLWAPPEVVKMTTSSAASEQNFIQMLSFLFQVLVGTTDYHLTHLPLVPHICISELGHH